MVVKHEAVEVVEDEAVIIMMNAVVVGYPLQIMTNFTVHSVEDIYTPMGNLS